MYGHELRVTLVGDHQRRCIEVAGLPTGLR
jgi:hypothetical protein